MAVTRVPNAVLIMLCACALGDAATAQTALLPAKPVRHARVAHIRVSHAMPGASGGSPAPTQTMSNLIKGSAAQQDLERRDNDLAGVRPVDHSHDELGSDLRGVQ